MHFTKATALAILHSACVYAATMKVLVGQNNGLTFTPSTINAQAGDQVQFVFLTQNHTVTSGDAATGCSPDGNFNSDFVPVSAAAAPAGKKGKKKGKKAKKAAAATAAASTPPANPPTFTVNVADTNPIMVYCAQAQHCQQGMVMAINPTDDGPTSLAAYQSLTANANTNTPANGGVTGGTLANPPQTQSAAKGKKKGKKAKGVLGLLAGARRAKMMM